MLKKHPRLPHCKEFTNPRKHDIKISQQHIYCIRTSQDSLFRAICFNSSLSCCLNLGHLTNDSQDWGHKPGLESHLLQLETSIEYRPTWTQPGCNALSSGPPSLPGSSRGKQSDHGCSPGLATVLWPWAGRAMPSLGKRSLGHQSRETYLVPLGPVRPYLGPASWRKPRILWSRAAA